MPLSPQFEQVPLFMSGTDLKNRITDSRDRPPMGTMEQMWKSKLRGSRRGSQGGHEPLGPGTGGGVYKSLKEHGWQGPGPGLLHVRQFGAIPEFDHDRLSIDDMHHRVAAAADIEAKSKGKRSIWIPTTERTEFESLRPPGR